MLFRKTGNRFGLLPTGRWSASRLADEILRLAPDREGLSDQELLGCAADCRCSVRGGAEADADETLLAVGPLVFEAIRRQLGFRLYAVQLHAGIVLARGGIAEMATGEGKTLAAALPAAVWGLTESGVHVATVNQFLAERDHRQLRPVYSALGLSVALLPEQAAVEEKRAAYRADVVYASGYELGFDYLRDQAALFRRPVSRLGDGLLASLRGDSASDFAPVQRSRGMCIVDEIDSVLVDEARTPLVLSEPPGDAMASPQGTRRGAESDGDAYERAQVVAESLALGRDYRLDPRKKSVELTERGLAAVTESAPMKCPLRRPWAVYVLNALRAEHLLQRDVHYVVDDGIRLVDEFTGRIFEQRVLRGGLHQAVEAKERLSTSPENLTSAKICRQRFFSLYQTLSGMTGTASSARREFRRLFGRKVEQVPLARPSQRRHFPTRYFVTSEIKYRAICDDVTERHGQGQPVLVGSRTIRNSEVIAELLRKRGVPCQLLNGRQDLAEATAVAAAGRMGAVTVATNMAGRGTDIRLGEGVAERGGLHVIGVERHESTRIDQQLAGRCARQGDPGSVQFFVSAEDDLIRLYDFRLGFRIAKYAAADGELYGNLDKRINRLQLRVEGRHAAERAELLRQDQQLNQLLAQAAGIRTG